MGMEENSEAEKGLDLNPDEEEDIWVQTESNPSHAVHNKLEEAAEFKPKFRSVIPAKRKLVKTMILNGIVQFWSKISDPSFSSKAKISNTKKMIGNLVSPV
ncbi:hypothetical protein PS1_035769 [Malus domestica]